MNNVLSRLKAGTVALLRGGDVADLIADTGSGESAAVTAALANAVEAGTNGDTPAPAAEAKPDAGMPKKKDKAGRMPGDEGYDENDLADDEAEAEAEAAAPAPAQVPAADAAAIAEAREEGRAAEQARWSAVMGSPELAGREALASTMLTTTNLSADQIVANLKAAPKAAQAGPAGLDFMNPNIGAGASVSDSTPAGMWAAVHAKRAEAAR